MGDRANYAILHRGKLSIFYAHWGGPTVPRELKDGPAACERFIRAQERVRSKRLLDFTYMEGGIALDKDRKRAVVFGGPGVVNYDERVQARLLERLRPIWERASWTIEWARRYAYDLAAFLGIEGDKVEAPFDVQRPAAWDDVVKGRDFTSTLFARRAGEGWEVRRSSFSSGCVVHHGTRILEAFDELAPASAIDPSDLASVTGLLFDEGARRLVIVAPLFASLNAPHHVAQKARSVLPEWTVEIDVDLPPVKERLRSRGIDIAPADEPKAQDEPLSDAEIDAIIDRVLDYHPEEQIAALTEATEELVAGVVADAEAKGQTVRVIRNIPRAKKAKAAARTRKSRV